MPADPTPGKPTGAQAVERALRLLTLVARSDTPRSLADLCTQTGLNRTTVWRLLATLEEFRFVERSPFSKEYEAGPIFCDIASSIAVPYAHLVRLALPSMKRLNALSRESVLLAVPRFFGTLTVMQIDSAESVRLKDYTNQESSLLGSSTGKVVFAHLPEAEVPPLVEAIETWAPPAEATDIPALMQEIRITRKQGYGVVFGEYNSAENGVSAPVYAEAELKALLNVAGPAVRFTQDKIQEILPELQKEARLISSLLGQSATAIPDGQ